MRQRTKIKQRRIIICFAGFLAFSGLAFAKNEIDLANNPDIAKQLNIFQYGLVKTLGFGDLGDNTAYTFLYRDLGDKNPRGYSASIDAGQDGARLFFSASESCVEGHSNSSDVIEINGRNVQATSACVRDSLRELRIGYLIKTKEGNLYAVEEFKSKRVVLVRFRAMSIPFESEDFSDALRKADQQPL